MNAFADSLENKPKQSQLQATEDRGRKTEDRKHKTEYRKQKAALSEKSLP